MNKTEHIFRPWLVILFFSCIFYCSGQDTLSGKKVDKNGPGFEIHYKDTLIETPQFTIRLFGIISDIRYYKFYINVTNKTDSYFLFEPQKCIFTINGVAYPADEEKMFILPYGEIEEKISLKMQKNIYPKFQLKLAGISILKDLSPAQVPNFVFYGAEQSFTTGNFKCDLKSKDVEGGDVIKVEFGCIYSGTNIAGIQPQKSTILFSNGREFDFRQIQRLKVIEPNKEFELRLVYEDMSHKINVKKSDPQITWYKTFLDLSPTEFAPINLILVLNPKITNPKYFEE